MAKAKIYKIKTYEEKNNDYLKIIIGIVVYAGVLFIASNIFINFYVTSFLYCIVASIILSVLNYALKPILTFLTMPLSIVTLGLAYPIVNMIILKICDILMGQSFQIHGFLSTFFLAIFISLLKIVFDNVITNRLGGK